MPKHGSVRTSSRSARSRRRTSGPGRPCCACRSPTASPGSRRAGRCRRSSRGSAPSCSHAVPTASPRCSATTRSAAWLLLARRRHPDPRVRQPAGGVAHRLAALRRTPARRGRARARASRARRPRPAGRDAAGALRGPPAGRAAARAGGDRSAARVRAPLGRAVRRARRPRCPGDGAARRPPHGERLRARAAVPRARLGRLVDLAPVRVARRDVPVPRGDHRARPG